MPLTLVDLQQRKERLEHVPRVVGEPAVDGLGPRELVQLAHERVVAQDGARKAEGVRSRRRHALA